MFIRRTTYRLKPEYAQAEFEREMRENIRPFDIEGLVSTAHVPNDDGSWTVVAVWETKVNAMAAVDHIRAEWERQAYKVAEGPKVETAGVSMWESGGA
jgi:hypothetical protein